MLAASRMAAPRGHPIPFPETPPALGSSPAGLTHSHASQPHQRGVHTAPTVPLPQHPAEEPGEAFREIRILHTTHSPWRASSNSHQKCWLHLHGHEKRPLTTDRAVLLPPRPPQGVFPPTPHSQPRDQAPMAGGLRSLTRMVQPDPSIPSQPRQFAYQGHFAVCK